MSRSTELEELFEEATRTAAQQEQAPPPRGLPALRPASEKLDALLNLQLPALWQSAVRLEKLKAESHRVDGRIIGTGAADFTKGNTVYTLRYKDKIFQLIDVPGIEGDESKYIDMVREAVAKAHLVFYVNGTNKKPEKATAEKIRSYLRRGTQVCPLVNVRGSADTYEFEEDREALESKGVREALQQTIGVLEAVLGEKVLLKGISVQGLLAFSALAMQAPSGKTTIHPSRERDLAIQQRNYLKHFSSPKAMYEFSRIREVAQVLHDKLGTFREDIIESNKIKVIELLAENLGVLEKAKKDHQDFMNKVDPEFEKCRGSIEEALQAFERMITVGRRNLWNEFFNDLTEKADQIVAENFGDNELISERIEKAFKLQQNGMGERLKKQFDQQVKELQENLGEAMERLIQDMRRVEFQQQIAFDHDGAKAVYRASNLDMDLSLKEWGSLAFSVGSYAMTGAGIGSVFPGIGTAIGAAVGAAIGLLVGLLNFFSSKESRIRKAQAKVQGKIEEVRDEVLDNLSDEVDGLMKLVREEVGKTTLKQVESIYERLSRPSCIVEHQIALMKRIREQLEGMPRGTIHTIQS